MSRSAAAVRAHVITPPMPLRWALGASQALSTEFAAWLGERLFFTPPRLPLPSEALPLLRQGRRFRLRVGEREVTGWRWGSGPVVYLLHGWGGRGGRLAHLAPPLVKLGYSVVAFDAPGHGQSEAGRSSMLDFARALGAVVDLCGPAHAVVGHSLGAAAAALAVHWGLRPGRMVLLAPPANPAEFMKPFAEALGLRDDVVERLKARSEQRLAFRWTDLDVRLMSPQNLRIPLLVVHDRKDRTVPAEDGMEIAAFWGGRFLETSELGHNALLRDTAVLIEVLSFVTGADPDTVRATVDPAAAMDRWLFCPEDREAPIGR